MEFDDFKRRIIYGIIDNYHGDLSDWGQNEFPYDEIYDFLLERYLPKIESPRSNIFLMVESFTITFININIKVFINNESEG